MALKIKWTEPALQDLKKIADYIEMEWSDALADKFIEQVKERVKALTKQPYMGMVSSKYPL